MLRKNDIIKHEKFLDVAFLVLKATNYAGSSNLTVKGAWLNQGFTKTYQIKPRPETIRIPLTKLNEWLYLNPRDHTLPCIRKGEWLRVKK